MQLKQQRQGGVRKKSNSSDVLVNSEHNDGDKTYCGACHQEYQYFTEYVIEEWIGCDLCDRWYHFTCVGIVEVPDNYICDECKQFCFVANYSVEY